MKKLVFSLVFMTMLFILPSSAVQAKAEAVVMEGVYVDDIDVSAMTKEELTQAINTAIETKKQQSVELVCVGGKTVTLLAAEMGLVQKNTDLVDEIMSLGHVGNAVTRYKMKKDFERENPVFETEVDFDQELIQNKFIEACKTFDQEAEDFALKRENGAFKIIGGKKGRILDEKAAVKTVYDYMTKEWDGKEVSIELPTIIDEPMGSAAELQSVTDLLGSFSTAFPKSAAGRVANIQNGCRLLNGITLYPGEECSTLEKVTPFTEKNGYHLAGSYLNGLVVDSLGGGICQVSTTLYNAVLRAELEVTNRSSHSMSVSYVGLSADAAIAESAGKDFAFKNNLDYPVYIEGYITPEKVITFNIYGKETRKPGRRVEYISEVLSSTTPDTESIIQTSAQPIGYAKLQNPHIGYKARLIKVVYQDGVEVSRKTMNNSNYKMSPRTLTVGTATAVPEHANELQAAIATGNLEHVRQVAAGIAAKEQAMAAAAAAAQPAPAQ